MLFNSLEYLLFLPIIAIIFFRTKQKYRWLVLLVASYLFYMSWRVEYAILIFVSTTIDYWAGIMMARQSEKAKKKKYLVASLLINLGMLFSFKYLDFLNETVRTLLNWNAIDYPVGHLNILLPVGISFYTFQTLSYTIDIYRGDRDPEKHFGIFALYVSFFPQLVAGPIERSTALIPQFYAKACVNWQQIVDGTKLIVWGLFKKMVLGDNLGILVGYIYTDPQAYDGNMLIIGAFAFTIQIYCDASGYTDMAIGSAKILGIKLSDNFNRPYFSSSIAQLWRRWHITITDWVNDYLFNPLLKRNRKARYFYLVLVFVILGMWHGAGWQFVFFGLIHGLYILVGRLTDKRRKKLARNIGVAKWKTLTRNFNVLLTFTFFAFASIAFRSDGLYDTFWIMGNLFTGGEVVSHITDMPQFNASNIFAISTSFILVYGIELTNKSDLRNPFSKIKTTWFRWCIYSMVVFYILTFNVSNSTAFYYFQF